MATGGTNISNLVNYLKQEQAEGKYNKIYLCFDNDTPGHNARLSAIAAIEKLDYKSEIICHLPTHKDWNDDLVSGVRSRFLIKGDIETIVNTVNSIMKQSVDTGIDELSRKLDIKTVDKEIPSINALSIN